MASYSLLSLLKGVVEHCFPNRICSVLLCRICGLADVGRLAFQPLTPMFHMLDMRPGQSAYMDQLARAFEALRQALDSLEHDYQASSLAIREPANVPYPLLGPSRQVACSNMMTIMA